MSRKKPSKEWLQTQNKDPYVKQARESHYRSRAVYKLQEIDKKDSLIKPDYCVIDLGSAPGSWSQYASERIGANGRVIAVDILPMESIDGVLFTQGDFTDEAVEKAFLQQIGADRADLVISDMAPNLTGIRVTDQARSMAMAELIYDFCHQALKPGGDLLIKLFEGAGTNEYRQLLREHFDKVMTRKPGASRDKSREFYILARSYRL
ncbi:MAG: RlmE family RNA methyltransferase [Proteobacteria bacterium]|nr:RlmE family RNA methyltransferase [Pseudomonadota bacterium]NOG59803.1 RlmE family RNA methyltransferase [Pseudomonadota bacterium]